MSASTPVVQNATPPQDAHFSKLAVQTSTVRGVPPRDALFQNLTVGEKDFSFGQPKKDASFTNIAVVQLVSGTVSGNGTSFIGRV